MKILGLYFSGTGNTEWVSHTLENKLIKSGYDAKMYSIEDKGAKDVAILLKTTDLFIVLHPAYGNGMPEILNMYLQQLITEIDQCPKTKALSITVPALYAADGASASRPFFNSLGMCYIGAYNVFMSCNFNTFIPGFKIASNKQKTILIDRASKKLDGIIYNIEKKIVKFENTGFINRWIGKLENKPNRDMMKKYDVRINETLCIGCGKCVKICPCQNLFIEKTGKVVQTKGKCTVCLRCINKCPKYAIRFISKKGKKQFKQYEGPCL